MSEYFANNLDKNISNFIEDVEINSCCKPQVDILENCEENKKKLEDKILKKIDFIEDDNEKLKLIRDLIHILKFEERILMLSPEELKEIDSQNSNTVEWALFLSGATKEKPSN